MNAWNSVGLFFKLYLGVRLSIYGHGVSEGSKASLIFGSVGAVLLAWFCWDVVAYIKRNGGEDR